MTEATHHVHVQLIYSALLVSCIQYGDLKAFLFIFLTACISLYVITKCWV